MTKQFVDDGQTLRGIGNCGVCVACGRKALYEPELQFTLCDPYEYQHELFKTVGGARAEYLRRVSNMLATVPRVERAEEPAIVSTVRERLRGMFSTMSLSYAELRVIFDWFDGRRPAEPARAELPISIRALLQRLDSELISDRQESSITLNQQERTSLHHFLHSADNYYRKLEGLPTTYEPARAEEPKPGTTRIELDEYERANLLWLFRVCGYGPAGDATYPFTCANTGDWLGTIPLKLDCDNPGPYKPNVQDTKVWARQFFARPATAEELRGEEPKAAEVSERERELAETLAQAMSDWWNQENEATWQDRAERLLGRKAPQPTFAELKAERDQLRAELARADSMLKGDQLALHRLCGHEAVNVRVTVGEPVANVADHAIAALDELRAELAKSQGFLNESRRQYDEKVEELGREIGRSNEASAELAKANAENARLTRELEAEREMAAKALVQVNEARRILAARAEAWTFPPGRCLDVAFLLLQPPTDSAAKGDGKRFVNGDQVHRHYGATGGAGLANNPYVVTGLKAVSASLPTAEEGKGNGRPAKPSLARAEELAGNADDDFGRAALLELIGYLKNEASHG